MSNTVGAALMAFIKDCQSEVEVTRDRAKQLTLNILNMKEIPQEDRVKIAMAALQEWHHETADEDLLTFLAEFRLQIEESSAKS